MGNFTEHNWGISVSAITADVWLARGRQYVARGSSMTWQALRSNKLNTAIS